MAKAEILEPSSGFMVPLRRGQSLDTSTVSMLLCCLPCVYSPWVLKGREIEKRDCEGLTMLQC